MFTLLRRTFVGLALLGLAAGLQAQSPETRQYYAELDSLSQRLVIVHAGQVLMSKRADSLAQTLAKLKQRAASPARERALEEAYRTSQALAESLQKSQAEEQYVDQFLRQKAERLLKNLNTDLIRLAQELQNAQKRGEQTKQDALKQEIQVCRRWQKRCQEILANPPTTILIYEVRVKPEDDAATLARKADFLRDQADRLERETKRIAKKLEELRQEENLRGRLLDFAQEVAIFEPAREGVNRADNPGEAFGVQSGLDRNSEAGVHAALSSEFLITLGWPEKISTLSPQDLADWQKRLRRDQVRLRAQADSLKQRALEIEALRTTRHE